MPEKLIAPLRHPEVIAQLTLEEKASLTSGANFWNTEVVERVGVQSIMLTDGPHGVRKQGGKADHLGLNASLPATCFPTAAALAQSWDPGLMERVGSHLGAEARAAGVSVLLGPGLNIVRNPIAGRTFEYFSEDPMLSGDMAAGMVRGIQAQGVAACPKHFAVNSQEHLRMSIDEVVDERSLREIYLEGFRRVVEGASPRTVMTAYNKVNGTYANEHSYLLTDILCGEWGFDGVVVSDWGGNNDRVAALVAGNHLEMPSSGGITDREIVEAVRGGDLDEAVLDRRVDALLDLVADTRATSEAITPVIDRDRQHRAAVDVARRCLVLLRNEPVADGGRVLPLAPGERVAVIGDFAAVPRYQGAGSSLVNPTRVDDALSAIQVSGVDLVGYAPGFERFGRTSRRLRKEAVALARRADTVLLFLGLDESSEAEGVDRTHLRLPGNQLGLVHALTQVHKRVVVVLAGGGPVEMPFVDEVAAVLHTSLAGQGGGRAVADVLTGRHNPSGRLAVTFPLAYDDVPSSTLAGAGVFPGPEATAEHRDAFFVGYRYYTTRGVPVLYPFGHGLSYTTFEYSDLTVEDRTVTFTLSNTGDHAGREVAQVYAGPLSPQVAHARVQLAGFAGVHLQPGESRQITIPLDARAFQYYSVPSNRWVTPGGSYRIDVGGSVTDLRLAQTLTLDGAADSLPVDQDIPVLDSERLPAYLAADVQHVDDASFAALLGRTPPPTRWQSDAPLTLDDTVAQLRHTNWLGRSLVGLLLFVRYVLLVSRKPHTANNVMFLINMPLSKIPGFTGGKISRRAVTGFLRWVNR